MVCLFFSPVLPFLVGQQMELPTRPYLSLQNQLLRNAGGRGSQELLCFGQACCYNNNASLFALTMFSKLAFVLKVVYKSHLVNLGQSSCMWYSCKFVFAHLKKKNKASKRFWDEKWFWRKQPSIGHRVMSSSIPGIEECSLVWMWCNTLDSP